MLKCREIPWIENEEIAALVKRDLTKLDHEEKDRLIKALDARLMRLWDKIAFEREHNLVNYNELPPSST